MQKKIIWHYLCRIINNKLKLSRKMLRTPKVITIFVIEKHFSYDNKCSNYII